MPRFCMNMPVAGSTAPLGREELRELIYSVLNAGQQEQFEQEWQLCVSLSLPELGHFRLSVYYHQGNVEAAIRVMEIISCCSDSSGPSSSFSSISVAVRISPAGLRKSCVTME